MGKFEKGKATGRPQGIESIKESLNKIRHIPMVMDSTGRVVIDYSKLAKKRLTMSDMMHFKLMQDYLTKGGPDEYKMYLETIKAYYPQQRIKEVIIEKLPTPAPVETLSPERVTQILGDVNFNPQNYSDKELEAILNTMEGKHEVGNSQGSEANIGGDRDGGENQA